MYLLDLTLPTPAENMALDEALLDEAEESREPIETLRLWEPDRPMVVVGRSSRLSEEVHVETCRELGIPVLRRASGGAAVVTGPGCLMYALVLSCRLRPGLRVIDHAHHFVLDTLVDALRPLAAGIRCRGTSDLALGEAKFSGNSIRLKRENMLYHGTFLYDIDLDLIERCLAMPPRQPDYRQGRSHRAFVVNLPVARTALRQALTAAWAADETHPAWPQERMIRLAGERYGRLPV